MDSRKLPTGMPYYQKWNEYFRVYNEYTILYNAVVLTFQTKISKIDKAKKSEKLKFYLDTIVAVKEGLETIRKLDIVFKPLLKNTTKKLSKNTNKNSKNEELFSIINTNKNRINLQLYGSYTTLIICYLAIFDLEEFGSNYYYIKSAKEITDLCEKIYADNKEILEENHIELTKDVNNFYKKYVKNNVYAEIQTLLSLAKSKYLFEEYHPLFEQAFQLATSRNYIKEQIIISYDKGHHILTRANLLDINRKDIDPILYKAIDSFSLSIQLVSLLPPDNLLESVFTRCDSMCDELVEIVNHLYEWQDNDFHVDNPRIRYHLLTYALQCIMNLQSLQLRLKKQEFINQKLMENEIHTRLHVVKERLNLETASSAATSNVTEFYSIFHFFKPSILNRTTSLDSFFHAKEVDDREYKRWAGGRPPLAKR